MIRDAWMIFAMKNNMCATSLYRATMVSAIHKNLRILALISWLIIGIAGLDKEEYGVDVSWPTQHEKLLDNHRRLHGRQSAYETYIRGCYDRYSESVCVKNEKDRIAMNLAQPAFQNNFTHAGYAKVKAPDKVVQLLRRFWEKNREKYVRNEDWEEGNVHTNHWKAPTQILRLDNPDGTSLSRADRWFLVANIQEILERWTQTKLIPTSLYGIRNYLKGSVLAPHVDRLPLVISAILNVDQDVNEPWPLEVIGHDGSARNITMDPGDLVLYESHSVIHGRPFPLNGTRFASVFFHFEPEGYTETLERKTRSHQNDKTRDAKVLFLEGLSKLGRASSVPRRTTRSIPHYIEEDSEEARQWRQEYVFVREQRKEMERKPVKGVTSAHILAAAGRLTELKAIEAEDPESLFRSDSNGWKPIHEAARAGAADTIVYLVKKGADVNERTNDGEGANALWWAKQQLPDNHPVIQLLEQHGAIAIGPMQ